MKPTSLATLLAVAALASGCSSFHSAVEPGRDLSAYRHVFVERSLTDDHGLASHLAAAMQARGREASFGPMTMLPRSADLIIRFEDRWTWDFKNHITSLRISLVDATTMKQVGYASFEGPAATNAIPAAIVDRLLTRLFGPAGPPNPPE